MGETARDQPERDRGQSVVSPPAGAGLPLFAETRPRGRIHYARLESSARLQRTLAVLKRGGCFTTRQLMHEADICAVNTAVDELRENGFDVQCARKGNTWKYWIPK